MNARVLLLLAAVPLSIAPLGTGAVDDVHKFYLGCDMSLVPGAVRADGSVQVRKMETTLFDGPSGFGGCWSHVGEQQYFVGVDTIYGLRSGTLNLIATESELAPTTSVGLELSPSGDHVGVHTRIHVQTSLDGKTWDDFQTGQYNLVRVNSGANKIPIPLLSGGGDGTYIIQSGPLSAGPLPSKDWYVLTFTAPDTPFRYIRAHMGESATGGLSGYLDYLFGNIEVVEQGPAPAVTLKARTNVRYDCASDIMEDFVASHPCWYGDPCQPGVPLVDYPCSLAEWTPSFVSHWNSVSSIHTYPLGEAVLTRVKGTATFQMFRPNDPGQDAAGMSGGHLIVQTSNDGYTWTDTGSVVAAYDGNPVAFDFPIPGGREAKFVRLTSDKHPDYDDFYTNGSNAPLRRFEGLLLDSQLRLSGDLPAPGRSGFGHSQGH